MVLTSAGQHLPPRPKALTQRHSKRQHVVSDRTGETGMASLRAILAGERDPVQVAHLRNDRCPHDEDTMATARHGHWREEPLLAVAPAVALDAMDHQQISECARQIEAPLATFAERSAREALPPVWRPRQRTRHRPRFDVRGALPRLTGVDLTAMEGVDEPTAVTISSEMGLDRGRWPTVTHCTSWRGRCPPHQVSGGKVLSRSTKPCANRAATARRLAASCLQRSQSALGAFCRRMKARWGTPQAITATAHTLARLLDMLLKHGTASVRQNMADYAQQYHNRMVQNLTRRAKVFGDVLVQISEGPLA
jgi:hypothetical protein